jgi:ATP-dependent RNA helicase HelY
VVAEYAVARALAQGGKAFYTTPLKALSNQKFGDLAARYGPDGVGLLTGDVSHQPRAPVVVMTTEVLRNMLFARSSVLDGLAVVVLDEVHYLQDPYRGSVWEEVLVLTPRTVTFVCLSATVANADDFGAWLTSVRGPTRVVVETKRPVTLQHHYAVSERGREGLTVIPLLKDGRPNPAGIALDERRRRNARHRLRAPRRTEVAEYLDDHGMLPAITFIFSRAACDDATQQCLRDGLRLTSSEERGRIREMTEAAVEGLSDDDLRTLGYGPWSAALEAGIAPHHAGLVPAFRQAVESCFSAGLLKVVFATETLALGINMPARTVVVERFAKFRGSETTPLTSGEYQQLTGRAGRRGIDTVGHAMILYSAATTFVTAARIAAARPPDLRSSFHPTYNLAVNLVRRWSREEAHDLLRSSYGQWQASKDSVSLPAQLDRRLAVLAARGYVEGWRLTDAGEGLAAIYHECDLLVAEALRAGLFDGLSPARLAGVVSGVTFEARRREDEPPPPVDRISAERLAALSGLAQDLRSEERRLGLPRTRRPDPGLARSVTRWAEGGLLSSVLADCDVAPGDFVRNIRQLIDLLRQLAQVAPLRRTAEGAELAVSLLRRGVVAANDPALWGSATDPAPRS